MNNKDTAVLTNGQSGKRLTSEGKNAVLETLMMEQIAWYKKLSTPSVLSSVDPQMVMYVCRLGRNYTTVS